MPSLADLFAQDPTDEPPRSSWSESYRESGRGVVGTTKSYAYVRRNKVTPVSDSATIVQKLWNYCNVLRDDGLSYQDYIEQLTFLLFLKMADEQTQTPFNRPAIVPDGLDWPSLVRLDGDDLDVHYRHILVELGKQTGTLGVIFRKAQNKIQDPAKLKRLVSDLIDKEQWMTLDADVKGDAYEGLLAKNAEDVKSGAGQYFTPRPLIQAIVDVMRPTASNHVADPAAGTGGFLLSAYEHMKTDKLDPDEKKFLRDEALRGWEIVDATARLCAMNLLLHGIGTPEGDSLITVDDALRSAPSDHFDMVLTNPPFGKKSSYKVIGADGETETESMSYLREDFWATTSNKQLNFLQHVRSLLTINGRAAIVVPDNVLFEGGAGETVRRRLLEQCDVHTLLATSYWDLLCRWRKGQRVVFRPKAPVGESLDAEVMDLRLPHQSELYPEDSCSRPSGPRRFRSVLQPCESSRES